MYKGSPSKGGGDGGDDGHTSKKAKLDTSSIHTSDDDDDDDDDHDSSDAKNQMGKKGEGGDYSNLERLRKEKRLAMNRESARNRRRKKKEMMSMLEKEVEELNNKNKNLLATNESLTARVAQLEGELSAVRGGGMAGTLPGAGAFGAGAAGGVTDPLLAMQLQAGGLGGGLGGGLFGGGGFGGPHALQLMQLRQQALANAGGTGAGGAGVGPGIPTDSELMRLARERQGLQNRFGGVSNVGLNPMSGGQEDIMRQARINNPRLGQLGGGGSGWGGGSTGANSTTGDEPSYNPVSGRPGQQHGNGIETTETKQPENAFSDRKRASRDP